ncbi:hypothetical protein ABG768_018954, partial [Culter alburnus]
RLLNQVLDRNEVTVQEKTRIKVLQQVQATASRTQVKTQGSDLCALHRVRKSEGHGGLVQ